MIPSTASDAIKHGMLAAGQYARVLARTRFPGVAVLGYHGLRADDWPDGKMAFENLHVRRSVFDSQCRLLRDTCDPISLDDWRSAIAGRRPLPARPVLITFDDGYRSVATLAAPILAKYGLPAAVFACTDPIAQRRLLWFDHVAARDGEAAVEGWKDVEYESWRAGCVEEAPRVDDDDPRALMTPAELAALASRPGMEIGAHTARHAILSHASAARQREEIAESRDAIAAWTGRPVRAFAYPNGRPAIDYSSDSIDVLHDLGFDLAFTMRPAFATPDDAALERSRFLVVAEVSAAELAHRLAFAWPR